MPTGARCSRLQKRTPSARSPRSRLRSALLDEDCSGRAAQKAATCQGQNRVCETSGNYRTGAQYYRPLSCKVCPHRRTRSLPADREYNSSLQYTYLSTSANTAGGFFPRTACLRMQPRTFASSSALKLAFSPPSCTASTACAGRPSAKWHDSYENS